ncbi:hypothetical protein [Haloplanus salilacus]
MAFALDQLLGELDGVDPVTDCRSDPAGSDDGRPTDRVAADRLESLGYLR